VNLCDTMGRHALHLASEANSTAAIQFLVTDVGIDVNLQTLSAHDTALHFAAKVLSSFYFMCSLDITDYSHFSD